MVRLYLVTPDGPDPLPAARDALAALPRGGVALQLRQPSVPARELLARARALREVCTRHAAALLVNDRLDVALAAAADGVHLPARGIGVAQARALLGPGRLVARSCHDTAEVAAAAREGADFAVFGPVFDTPGKTAVGVAALGAACRGALTVIALGGIDATNARLCIDAGARGVACIRAVLGARDPGAEARRLWAAVAA